VFQHSKKSSGHFSSTATDPGLYKLCFSNTISSSMPKVVAFSLHVGDRMYQDIATHEHVTPLEEGVIQLQDSLAQIQDEQRYFWSRERSSRNTAESTNERVLWFSVVELVLIIGLGAWQLYTMYSIFQKKLRV